MNRSDTAGVALAVLLLVAALAAVPVGGGSAPAPETLASQGDFDSTEFRITVYENGSARWTFLFKRTLSNDTERQNFEAYAENFNANETDLYRDFQSRAQSLVTEGEDVTGRDMTATDFSKRAYTEGLNDNRGIVRMSFRWTGFGATEGERVVVGDVFEGGLYVGPDQTLVVTHGDGLVITDFKPSPDDQSDDTLTYRGEREFSDNRPQVTFGPPGAATATQGTPSDSATGGGVGPGDNGGGLGVLPIVALLVLLALGVGAAYAFRTGMLGGGGDDGGDATSTAGAGDGGDGGGVAGAAGAASTEPAISDEELLSDDDRVMKMLEERGGRMKQVKIVEETGWSKSKVSMLLSDMEEEGQISKLRVGRENIVSIAGQEPEAAGSPFDEDE
jgi:hypothetical protein